MLNDAVCFKAVYIVCGYTDLRSGIGSLAAILESQTGSTLMCRTPCIFSMAGVQTVSRDWCNSDIEITGVHKTEHCRCHQVPRC